MATKKPAKKKKAASKPKAKSAPRRRSGKSVSRKSAPRKSAPKKSGPKVPPPPPPDALLERGVHPKLTWLLANLAPGRHADGMIQFALPGAHAAELEPWLMGRTEGRTSIGRTAFGELLVFRVSE